MKTDNMSKTQIYCGVILNPQVKNNQITVAVFDRGYLTVNNGRVVSVSSEKPATEPADFHDFGEHLILPGLIDTHTHLAQYGFTGIGGLPLLPWLEKYTFPHEADLLNTEKLRAEARAFFKASLANGTTTTVAYVNSDYNSTLTAFDEAESTGIRAYLGQVLMNLNTPDKLARSVEQYEEEQLELIHKFKDHDRLQTILTPRFAISCSSELMRMAGRLSRENNLPLQTHLSENKDEIKTVAEMYPQAGSYTEVYDRHDCLHEKTLLGHCIHLSPDEKKLIRERGAVAVHCPSSNLFLASGAMPLTEYLNENIKVSLGTDIAAGFSLNMLREAGNAYLTANIVSYNREDDAQKSSIETALYLATLAGAEALGRGDELGSLEAGKKADFIVVDDSAVKPLDDDKYNRPLERLSRLLFRAETGCVKQTYINGEPLL